LYTLSSSSDICFSLACLGVKEITWTSLTRDAQAPSPKSLHAPGSLNLAELVLDESFILEKDLLQLVILPKALEVFRWSGIPENVLGSGPPYEPSSILRPLVDALLCHRDSLQCLDVTPFDIKWKGRNKSNLKFLLPPLKDFPVLRTLTIPCLNLCGDATWGVVPYKISTILPATLESLCVRSTILRLRGKSGAETVCTTRLKELALEASTQLPLLRSFALIITGDWQPAPEDQDVFGMLEKAFVDARIAFEVRKGTRFGMTSEPWVQRVRGPWTEYNL